MFAHFSKGKPFPLTLTLALQLYHLFSFVFLFEPKPPLRILRLQIIHCVYYCSYYLLCTTTT